MKFEQIEYIETINVPIKTNKWDADSYRNKLDNLINIWQMFNVETDDLAKKPYIPHKSLLQWIVANVLRDNIDIVIFDLRGHGGC